MATVTVEINGRPHQIGCAEGQEKRVTALASQFDRHVRQVAGDVGQVGDLRLFLMAGLLLADENADLKSNVQLEPTSDDSAVIEALNAAAERIEKLAAGL